MKEGMKVRVLIGGRSDIAELTGTITEYPYCGDSNFAWVEFDNPPGAQNGHCFKAQELEAVG